MKKYQDNNHVQKYLSFWRGKIEFVSKFFQIFKEQMSENPQMYPLQIQYIKHLQDNKKFFKNQLICSPTGSGKTFVFIMKILHLLSKKSQAQYRNFKCIYVAPMKAICQQKLYQFNRFFKHIPNLKVVYLSSQSEEKNIVQLQYEKNQIIICTPEICFQILKKILPWEIFKNLDLLLIDQIHLIDCEQRGSILQTIVNRALQTSNNNLQISCTSASIPNKDDIAVWLNAKTIQNPYKLVQLKMVQYYHKNLDNVNRYFNTQPLIIELPNAIKQLQKEFNQERQTKNNQNYLIFCTRKRNIKNQCKKFIQILPKNIYDHSIHRAVHYQEHQMQQINQLIQQIKNKQLKDCLLKRCGYHHASLESAQKQIVLKLFQKGWIIFLFSTSTLSQGVNLPAKAVIILDLFRWLENEKPLYYKNSEIDQMIGRAGRNKLDQFGYFTILGRTNTVKQICQYYNNNNGTFKLQNLRSKIMYNFQSITFFQLYYNKLNMQNQSDKKKLLNYFSKSLYAVQYKKQINNSNQNQAIEEFNSILAKKIQQTKEKFQRTELNFVQRQKYVYQIPYFQVTTYMNLFQYLKLYQDCNEENFLRLFSNLKQVQKMTNYQPEDNLTAYKQFYVPFNIQFNKKNNQKNNSKCLMLTYFNLSNKIQKVNDEHVEQQSYLLTKILGYFCQMIKEIYFTFLDQRANLTLINPQILFFSAIYQKYCRFNASHYNHIQCWKSLTLKQINFQFIYNQQNQSKKEKEKNLQNSSFFDLKEELKIKPIQMQLFIKNQQFKTKDLIQHLQKYQISVDQNKIKPKNYNGLLNFYIFRRFDQLFQYIYKQQKKNFIQFDQNDKNEYKIVIIFENVIGVDTIISYREGSITKIKNITLGQNKQIKASQVQNYNEQTYNLEEKQDILQNQKPEISKQQKILLKKEQKKKLQAQQNSQVKKENTSKKKDTQNSRSKSKEKGLSSFVYFDKKKQEKND